MLLREVFENVFVGRCSNGVLRIPPRVRVRFTSGCGAMPRRAASSMRPGLVTGTTAASEFGFQELSRVNLLLLEAASV